MVAVFAIFATLSSLEFKQMGVGLAVAVLIDATLVRAVLLPGDDEAARRLELVPAQAAGLAAAHSARASAPEPARRRTLACLQARQPTASGTRPGGSPAIAIAPMAASACSPAAATAPASMRSSAPSCARAVNAYGHEFVGFRYGWAGVARATTRSSSRTTTTRGILHRGGTILGTSRTNPYKEDGGLEQVRGVAGGSTASTR